MYISLKTKIWILFNLCVLAITLFAYFYFPAREYQYHVDVYKKEIDYIAKTIASGVTVALSESNFQGIKTSLEYARSDSRLKFVAMVQSDSVLTNKGEPTLVYQVFKVFPEDIKIDANIQSDQKIIVNRAGFTSDIMNGTIIIGFSTSEILLNVEYLQRSILIAAIFILLITSFVSYFISKTITRPLEYLRDASQQISSGKLDFNLNIERNDELGDLVKAFSTMVKDLDRSRTSIKQQKASLEKTNHELRALNEEKNNLIAIVSHDLRSPLNRISGLLSLLKLQNLDLKNDDVDLLSKMEQCAERMNDMIVKILAVESLEMPDFSIKKEKNSVNEILKEVIDNYKTDAFKKDIKLISNCENIDYFVQADKQYAILIMDNLVSNAIKFSPKKSSVKIEVADGKSDEFIVMKVIDEGPGISREDQSKLFQKYQRLKSKPTDGETSIGLGLSIVKKYAEMMGGEIYYEDRPTGSTFVVKLLKTEGL